MNFTLSKGVSGGEKKDKYHITIKNNIETGYFVIIRFILITFSAILLQK